MPHARVHRDQRTRAKELRRVMTRAETLLWRYIKAHRIGAFGYRRQATMGPYIVDFVCHSARLVVEVDGSSHDYEDRLERDTERDAWFAARGYAVLRFTDQEVLSNLEGVILRVQEVARAPVIPPAPPL